MCTMTGNMVKEDGQALSKAVLSLAKVLRPSDPAVADDLAAASEALLAVTNNWDTTTPVETFNTVATALEAVLAEIPQTAAIAPFIPIVVAALDVLIAQIPTSPAAGQASTTPTASAVRATHAAIATHAEANPNQHRIPPAALQTVHHAFIHNPRGDFRVAWDNMVDAHPDLGVEKV